MIFDTDKYEKHLESNGGMGIRKTLLVVYWSFFNFKKCFCFYVFCENGYSNFRALEQVRKMTDEEVKKMFRDNLSPE